MEMTDKQFSAYVRQLIKNLENVIEKSKGKGEEAVIRELEDLIADIRQDIAN
ncbi:MAG: hypothetical protein LBM59_00365 [Ruminococcus sp.]|jgi:hypothetical protein|nr:hypothetical protein [Ruminococcus sp.]